MNVLYSLFATPTTSIVCCTCIAAVAISYYILSRAAANKDYDKFQTIHPPSESAVLVTGGNRGIGRGTADYLAARGYTVFITVRKLPFETKNENIHPILLDVTNDNHMAPAVQAAQEILTTKKKKLVAIVNNAGVNPEQEIIVQNKREEKDNKQLVDPSVAEQVFACNVVGIARVTRAFLPLLFKTKDKRIGRIVNIGSYFGSVAGLATLSHVYYEASKFAVEGLSDGMRRNLKNEGILVSLIKPGNIQTDMNPKFGEAGIEVVAKDIYHAIASPNPLSRYYPGTVFGYNCHLLCWAFDVLPTWITDNLNN